jgi:two-component sensor histidine kinase/integral membrane sensor domain MASE1
MRLPHPPTFLALTAVYFAAACASFGWFDAFGVNAPLWPTAGIILFALLRFGLGYWPVAFLGSLLAHALVVPVVSSFYGQMVTAATSAGSALLAALVFRRLAGGRPPTLGSTRIVIALSAAMAVKASVAAVFGMTLLAPALGYPFERALSLGAGWFFADFAGAVVVAPLLLFWWPCEGARPLPDRAMPYFGLCLVVTAALAVMGFSARFPNILPYHIFVPLIWAALGFRLRGATAALAVVAVVGLAMAANGSVMFNKVSTANSSVLLAQFLVVAGIAGLLLAAATDERRAQAVLKASRDRLDYVLDAAGMIGWEIDNRTGRITHVGDHDAFFGGSIPDRESFFERVHPDDRAALRRAIEERPLGEPYAREYRIVRPDGSVRWVSDRGQPSKGDPYIVTGVNTDITERKETELALAEESERLHLAQEAASIGVWEMRLESRKLYWAPELYRLWSRDPALGPPNRDEFLRMIHPDDVAASIAAVDGVKPGDVYNGEFRVRGPDGGWRWLASRARLLPDGHSGYRWLGINIDISDRKATEERQALLTAELDHRVKNILATIQALIVRTAPTKTSVEDLATTLQGRVQAMSRAHSMLAGNRWESASLARLLRDELSPYGADRAAFDGPDVQLVPRAALSISLALHELATNAAKYGALSNPAGRVEVRWRMADGALALDWTETGGPALAGPPTRRGFGSAMTERVIRHEFGGMLEVDYPATGIVARIRLPAEKVIRAVRAGGETTAAPAAPPPRAQARLDGVRVLAVEDTPLIAVAVEAALTEAGAVVTGPFANAEAALAALAEGAPDVAVLDINLQGGTAIPVAEALAARGIPFLFATGYGDDSQLPPELRDRPRLLKPFDDRQLVGALSDLLT